MIERLSTKEINELAVKIETGEPVEGYPLHHQRLTLAQAALYFDEKTYRWHVPEGEWHIDGHPNRVGADPLLLDPEVPNESSLVIPDVRIGQWVKAGLDLDQHNRPMHPHWRQLLGNERIGLPTGIGFFYRYGPNMTVDTVVHRQNTSDRPREILLIQRKDTNTWALPGGFVDPGEDPAVAAKRETGEETGIRVSVKKKDLLLRRLPIGRRSTLHAWTENQVFTAYGNQDYLYDTTLQPADDAEDAGWFTAAQIEELKIFDDHRLYIETALRHLG